MNKAIIFDIIRNSFVDGPGIRTTVFFKGCNLHCEWCHNPESQSPARQMMFYKNRCIGCNKCKEVCTYDLKKCGFCGKCELYCPGGARQICGREMSVREVLTEIVKDKDFYEMSGGGVTFSGGECMMQIGFLEEILKRSKENDIHTAVDTAGNVKWGSFERIISYTDLFLYDIKLYCSEKHKRYTGSGNSLILENLKRLSDTGKEIIIRIPIIGGVNDNKNEMQSISEFLKPLNISKVELLPYHKMGENKSAALNYDFKTFNVPNNEKLNEFQKLF